MDSKVVPATGGTAACRAAADRKEEDTIGVRRIVAVVELDIHKSDTVLAQVGDTKHMRQLQDKLQLCKEKHKEEGHMTRSPAAATTCKVGRTEHNVREACAAHRYNKWKLLVFSSGNFTSSNRTELTNEFWKCMMNFTSPANLQKQYDGKL